MKISYISQKGKQKQILIIFNHKWHNKKKGKKAFDFMEKSLDKQ